jgi:cystathionine beta-lyase/cystathionine gamma-synthase
VAVGAVRRLAQPAELHAGALRHRDHLRQAAATSTAGAPPSGPNTKLLFGETLGNPGLDVLDIPTVSAIAHDAGLPLLVDSTFTTPWLMKPFDHGADLIFHSATKFLSGHGTVVGGVLVDSGAFDWAASGRFPELSAPYGGFHGMVFSDESTVGAFLLRARREGLRDFGACMSPHTAWLILQGIETLPLRMARHVENTRKIVAFLAAHPMVARVGYPELEGHPSHALAKKLLPRGCGAVFSFDLKGSRKQGQAFIEALKIFSHLANVGDCRSLVIHPASTTHFRMDDARWRRAGIGPGTIRLSIGLEDADDLIDDLKRAEGGGEGPHEARCPRPHGPRLHRRQALRPRPALRRVRARRAARPQRVDAAGALVRSPRPRVLAVDLPGHGQSEGPPLPSVRGHGRLAAGAAGRRRRAAGGAGRPQHGLADRAGSRGAGARSASPGW